MSGRHTPLGWNPARYGADPCEGAWGERTCVLGPDWEGVGEIAGEGAMGLTEPAGEGDRAGE